jgi:methyl-accepting chemotaxis protein
MRNGNKGIGFGAKIMILVLVSSIGLATVSCAVALKLYVSSYHSFIDKYKKSLYADFDSQAKNQVDAAISVLQIIYDRQKNGEITLEEAKRLSYVAMKDMRYGKNSYFFVYTPDGVCQVLMGDKTAEGSNRLEWQDKKGNFLVKSIIKAGLQPEGGYADYWWPKKNETTPLLKRTYLNMFKPYEWIVGTGNYVEDMDAMIKKVSDESYTSLKNGIYLIIGIAIFLAFIISIVSLMVTRRLLRSIGTDPAHLADITQQVAAGDLTYRFETDKSGVYDAMRQMVVQLRDVMDKVNRSSQDVASASVELNSNAEQMANASQEVVGQANTAATASEEMSSTCMDIANNCHRAAESSHQASKTAQAGADIVKKTVDGMTRIADKVRSSATVVEQLGTRSDQIGAIVATIEDIADQTNLLALNAAIEAARAGEQGRGFAVVADEVRALAERTSRATHEIGEMIKNIQRETRTAVSAMEDGVREVEQGTNEAARSGQALEEILEKINEVTVQISQIATAAEEQTATTREISNNIQQISDVVNTSAKGSQDISKSSASLSQLSVDLQDMVRKFKV